MLDKFIDCTIERHGHYLFYENDQGREVGFVRMFDVGELQKEPKKAKSDRGLIHLLDELEELKTENAELDEMNQYLRKEIKEARQPLLREKQGRN